MRLNLTSLMSIVPQPAFALAGAGTSIGVRYASDGYSTAVKNPLLDVHSKGRIVSTLFAINNDDTVDVPPRIEESREAGSDPVPPEPAQSVTAYDVYTSLLSIPVRHNVMFNDQALVDLLGTRGWMVVVSRGERDATEAIAAKVGPLEAELARLEGEMEESKPTLGRLFAAAKGFFGRKKTTKQGDVGDRKDSLLNLTGVYRTLKARKRELEKEIEQAKIAKEWFDYTAWSNCGCILLTDAGRKILAALDGAKDDSRMETMSVDEFLKLIG